MDTRQAKHELTRRRQGGFTFIEVLLALVILASASAILVGMQSAAISRAIRDRNAQQAMLFARRIMSSVEILGESGDIQASDEQPALQMMQAYGVPNPSSDLEKKALEPLKASLMVEEFPLPIPIPNKDPALLRKLTLKVSWGTNIDDSFVVASLLPAK
jgi:prepilin-type N-terminal cleavage/methylation domain-containing protein